MYKEKIAKSQKYYDEKILPLCFLFKAMVRNEKMVLKSFYIFLKTILIQSF
jgi:hypothetical protein